MIPAWHASKRLIRAGSFLALVSASGCEFGFPTETFEEMSFAEGSDWPDTISVSHTEVVTLAVALGNGASVTGTPVRWHSSDSSVVMVEPATLASGADHQGGLAARFQATVRAVGRGTARITVELDSIHGYSAQPLEHDVHVLEKWVQVSAGGHFTCAVAYNQDAYCWGNGQFGQLGNGGSLGTLGATSPQPVLGGIKFISLDAGFDHVCGQTEEEFLHCWGFNLLGQLGIGSDITRFAPERVALARSFTSVTAGHGLTCAQIALFPSSFLGPGAEDVTNDIAVCWGSNFAGQIGSPTPRGWQESPSTTNQLQDLSGELIPFREISAGGTFACGIKEAIPAPPEAWCWGDNTHGQLGNPGAQFLNIEGTFGVDRPVPVIALRDDGSGVSMESIAVSLSASWAARQTVDLEAHACGLTPEGEAWCWGSNNYGQLGNPSIASGSPVAVPVQGSQRFRVLTLGEGTRVG